jgi:two-component system, NtrC family, nitrogen regulation sensor histidine kinase GlnL
MSKVIDTEGVPRPRLRSLDTDRLLEALPVAVVGVDDAGAIRFANAAAADLLAGAHGLLGRRVSDVFGAGSPLATLAARAHRAQEHLQEGDVRLPTSSGTFTVTAAPAGDDMLVCLVLTPTLRRRVSGGPVPAARTLAHEVRNPLAGIRAAAQLIGRGADEDVATLATLICDEVDRIRRLTDRIDPFAAIEQAQLVSINVHEALDRVRRIVESGSPQITVIERYDPSLPNIRGDLDQLIQALLNIAKNAAEALGEMPNGEIVFATSYRPGLRVRRAIGGRPRPQLEIAIIDNGPGLAVEIADRLFEAFATTKSGGMGLGLAIASDVIARHDGTIEVESATGRTAFRILLPIATNGDTP